jgi:predicted  nucleic acid-binding Zn ribbon protein
MKKASEICGRENIAVCYINSVEILYQQCTCGEEGYVKVNKMICPRCLKVLRERIEIEFDGNLSECKECKLISPDTWDAFFMETV